MRINLKNLGTLSGFLLLIASLSHCQNSKGQQDRGGTTDTASIQPEETGSSSPVPVTGTNLTATYDNAEPICSTVISGVKVITGCYIAVRVPSSTSSGTASALSLSDSLLPADSASGVEFEWARRLKSAGTSVSSKRTIISAGLSATYELPVTFIDDGGDPASLIADVLIKSTSDTRTRSLSVHAPVDPPGSPSTLTATSGPRSCKLAWNGDGASYLVVRRSGSEAVSWTPTDVTTYAVGALTASEQLVFSGSQLSYVDGGLAESTTYQYSVFARNSAGKYSEASETFCTPTSGGSPLDLICTNSAVKSMVTSSDTLYLGGAFTQIGYCVGGGIPLQYSNAAPAVAYRNAPKINGSVWAAADDGSGGYYIGGQFSVVNGQQRLNLAHLNADGSLSDWNPGANSTVRAVVVSGTTVYVGGDFSLVGNVTRRNIAAVSTSGSVLNWDPNLNSSVFALKEYGGNVYFGGTFTTVSGTTRNYLAGVQGYDGTAQSGTLLSWNPNPNTSIFTLELAGSTLYVGGQFTSISGQTRNYAAAYNLSTSSLLSWNPNPDNEVYGIAASGSSAFLTGVFTHVGGTAVGYLAKVDATTGALSGTMPSLSAYGNVLAISGSTLYVGGTFLSVNGVNRFRVAAITTAGVLTSWNPSWSVAVKTLTATPNSVFIGGAIALMGYQTRAGLAAIDSTGTILNWGPAVAGSAASVDAMVMSGSSIFIGGSFTSVNGVARGYIAEVGTDGALDLSWNPGLNLSATAIALDGSTVFVGGNFTTVGNVSRKYLAAINTDGTLGAWDPNPNGAVSMLTLDNSVAYTSGVFSTIGGATRSSGFASVSTTGTGTATSWNPNPNGTVASFFVDSGIAYLGGSFTTISAVTRNHLAAYTVATGAITSWNPNSNGDIWSMAFANSKIYAGGAFTYIGGPNRVDLAQIDTTGALGSWNPSADNAVSSMQKFGSSLAIGGSFTTIGSKHQTGFAVIDQ